MARVSHAARTYHPSKPIDTLMRGAFGDGDGAVDTIRAQINHKYLAATSSLTQVKGQTEGKAAWKGSLAREEVEELGGRVEDGCTFGILTLQRPYFSNSTSRSLTRVLFDRFPTNRRIMYRYFSI